MIHTHPITIAWWVKIPQIRSLESNFGSTLYWVKATHISPKRYLSIVTLTTYVSIEKNAPYEYI